MTDARIVVVGGGLAGTAVVHALAGAGTRDVVWIDAGGARSSDVPVALVHPLPGRSLAPRPRVFEAWAVARDWLDALPAIAGVHRAVLYRVVRSDEAGRRLLASWSRHRAEIEGALGSSFVGRVDDTAIEYGPVYAFDPGGACDALADRASPSVQRRTGRVVGWTRQGGAWRCRLEDGTAIKSAEVVLAAGVGALALLEAGPDRSALEPVAGTLRHAEAVPLDRFVVDGGHVASTTRRVAWGSTYRPAAVASPDDDDADRFAPIEARLRAAGAPLPDVPEVFTGTRVVHRRTRLPWVGTVAPGLHVMTAFGSQGGLWIPAAAAHVADHLHAGEPVPRWPAS